MISYVLLISMLVICIVYFYSEPRKITISSLGNELSAYFYSTNSLDTINDSAQHKQRIAKLADKDLISFYKKWNWRKSEQLIDFKSGLYDTWNQPDSDGNAKPNYLLYWQTLRPLMQNFYAQNLPHKEISVPVVHFRCSDAPFIKCPRQSLTKRSSVEWMAAQIKQRGFNAIILLSCHKHKSVDTQNSCQKYADFYASIFTDNGIAVTKQCSSIYDDFVTMVNSPLLVSLNASSYSFMAGVAKDPRNYISCNMGLESEHKYYLQDAADWILDPRAPLLHAEVADYHDVDAVIRML